MARVPVEHPGGGGGLPLTPRRDTLGIRPDLSPLARNLRLLEAAVPVPRSRFQRPEVTGEVRELVSDLRAVSEALSRVEGTVAGRSPERVALICRRLADDLVADPSNPVHRIAGPLWLRRRAVLVVCEGERLGGL